MADVILEMKSITKEFPGVKALDNVNLKVEAGEIHALIGENGAGKSTLMNMLGCLDVPSSGEYILNGQNVSRLTDDELSDIRNQEIGFIFASSGPRRTARPRASSSSTRSWP